MSESFTEHSRVVVPPLGHFLWIQNLGDTEQWFTATGQDGAPLVIKIDGHQVVRYGPFLCHVEFACALSPSIRLDALPSGSRPPELDGQAAPLKLGAPDPLAPRS